MIILYKLVYTNYLQAIRLMIGSTVSRKCEALFTEAFYDAVLSKGRSNDIEYRIRVRT